MALGHSGPAQFGQQKFSSKQRRQRKSILLGPLHFIVLMIVDRVQPSALSSCRQQPLMPKSQPGAHSAKAKPTRFCHRTDGQGQLVHSCKWPGQYLAIQTRHRTTRSGTRFLCKEQTKPAPLTDEYTDQRSETITKYRHINMHMAGMKLWSCTRSLISSAEQYYAASPSSDAYSK